MKALILAALFAGSAAAQCGSAGKLILNPLTHMFDCTAVPGVGTGTVTVVGGGNLTSTALVTGGGSQALRTPCATCTLGSNAYMLLQGTVPEIDLSVTGAKFAGIYTNSAGIFAAYSEGNAIFEMATNTTLTAASGGYFISDATAHYFQLGGVTLNRLALDDAVNNTVIATISSKPASVGQDTHPSLNLRAYTPDGNTILTDGFDIGMDFFNVANDGTYTTPNFHIYDYRHGQTYFLIDPLNVPNVIGAGAGVSYVLNGSGYFYTDSAVYAPLIAGNAAGNLRIVSSSGNNPTYQIKFETGNAGATHSGYVDQFGIWTDGGAVPSAGTCGTSPSLATGASNNAGTINIGSGTATACTVTFSGTLTHAPACTVTTSSTTALGSVSAVSTSAVTFTFAANLASGKAYYNCL